MLELEPATFIISRQDTPNLASCKESFEISYRQNMNTFSGLMEIQKNPINTDKKATIPVKWDMNTLEKIC